MKHEYLNEYNPDHFWTQRRAMPPWHPPTPALDADKVVFIIVMLIALIALLGVWASEGGL